MLSTISCVALIAVLAASSGCKRVRAEPKTSATEPGLSIDLTPEPKGACIRVEAELSVEAATSIRALSIPRDWAGTRGARGISRLEIADADGPIAFTEEERGAEVIYAFSRAVHAPLGWRYRALAPANGGSFLGVRVDTDAASATGNALLVLPQSDAAIPVHLRWHLGALGAGAAADASLGSGDDVRKTATPPDLSDAIYAAGKLTSIGVGGGIRAGVVGAPRVDPASALALGSFAAEKTAALAGERASDVPFSYFFVGVRGAKLDHEGAFLGRSFGVFFDAERELDPALRILAMHESLHRVFGGAVAVTAGGADEAWFSEGFATHYARKLLFDAGRIDASDMARDLSRARPAHGGARDPEAYARGSILAATLDARIRKVSKGTRSLDDLVRTLAGSEHARSLSASDVAGAARTEGGDAAAADVEKVASGGSIDPPDDLYGPCFSRVDETVPIEIQLDRTTRPVRAGTRHVITWRAKRCAK